MQRKFKLMRYQLGNPLSPQIRNQLWNQLGNQLGNQFRDQLDDELSEALWELLWGLGSAELHHQIMAEVYNATKI